MAWGRAKPSYTGTPWETPSPESITIPVVRPEAYRERTAWMATYMAGKLKVSNMIWVIFSLLALGLRGASVRRTGCSSGATRSSLYMVWCQIFSMSSQLVMIPCSTGYLRVRIPLLDCASSPTYASFCPIPTITPWCLGRPTMEGKTALGASSPAKPALHIPEPLSQTRAATSSSHILGVLNLFVGGYLSTQLGGLPMYSALI